MRTTYDEVVDAAFEQDVRDAGHRPPPAARRDAAGRRPRRPVRRHPGLAPDPRPGRRLEGLFLATGGSGHCFKLGPAIGELVAGAVLGLQPAYADVRDFSLARFAEGREFRSTYGGNRA